MLNLKKTITFEKSRSPFIATFARGVALGLALGIGVSFSAAVNASDATDPAAELLKAEKMTQEEVYAYKQTEYKLVDPTGDVSLYRRTEKMFGSIFKVLKGDAQMAEKSAQKPKDQCELTPDECATIGAQPDPSAALKTPAQIEAEIRALGLPEYETRKRIAQALNDQKPLDGEKNPIRRQEFAQMLTEVMVEERKNGIEPVYGTPHDWSPAFIERQGTGGITGFSKILVALASGHSLTYMVTGQETALIQAILSQPENSITLDSLFRASYRLNRGDVYLTLLTIENVLARNWRNPERESLPITKRLKQIVASSGKYDDQFGTWYHLFGMILYGYVTDSTSAWWVGRIENLGSWILGDFDRPEQKSWMNRMGGRIGEDLRLNVQKQLYLRHQADPKYLREDRYLNHSEDFRDRIHVALYPGLSAYTSLDRRDSSNVSRIVLIVVKSEDLDLKNCKVEIMPGDQSGFRASRKIVREDVSFRKGRYTTIYTDRVDGDSARGFISGCEGTGEEYVFEAR